MIEIIIVIFLVENNIKIDNEDNSCKDILNQNNWQDNFVNWKGRMKMDLNSLFEILLEIEKKKKNIKFKKNKI